MKNHPQPIRATIFLGLIGGLLFIPLSLGLGLLVHWPQVLYLPIWLFVALYSGLLTRWSLPGIKSVLFPLILILVSLPWVDSMILFMVLILGTLSWIRSGICFSGKMGIKIVIETFICLLAGVLFAILSPTTLLSWSLAVWMFFLAQALFFVFIDTRELAVESVEPDPFAYAREQAETILANQA